MAKTSQNKQKPTARKAARDRTASSPRAGGRAVTPASTKQISQGRFPGETPLTGEDRPKNRPGGKKQGQHARKVSR